MRAANSSGRTLGLRSRGTECFSVSQLNCGADSAGPGIGGGDLLLSVRLVPP
jgi:hypothetical protein